MNVEIISKPLSLDIYGFSGTAVGKDYAGTAFALMGRMWQTVRSHKLAHKGLNIWVYEPHERVFAGVELEGPPDQNVGLELKEIRITTYAYYKHVGPYQRIRHSGQEMRAELERRGLAITTPYVEIYGHWTKDEDKLETELFMAVE